jgi:hypothetical protein
MIDRGRAVSSISDFYPPFEFYETNVETPTSTLLMLLLAPTFAIAAHSPGPVLDVQPDVLPILL